MLRNRFDGLIRCGGMRLNRPALFKGRHFEPEMIILCVRRYLRFCLSYRNMEELMAERNPHVDHVTIWRWVQRYAPEMNRRCRPELRNPNRSWRSMKLIFGSPERGPIYIERWTLQGRRLIFFCLPDAMRIRPNAFYRKHYAHRAIRGRG